MYTKCNLAKYNITLTPTSNHHETMEGVFGFGARRYFSIKQENGSSIDQYAIKKGQEYLNKIFEDSLIKAMEQAGKDIKNFIGHDLHLVNSTQLVASAQQDKEWICSRFSPQG